MDGFKTGMNTSVQRRLSIVLALAIVAVATIAGAFSFGSALNEAHELQDATLEQIARSIGSLPPPSMTTLPPHLRDTDDEAQVVVQTLADPQQTQGSAAAPLPLPKDLSDGLHTLTVGRDDYRVLAKTQPSGVRLAIAQQTALRDEIARDSALRTVAPFLVLIPILLVIASELIRRMFHPIAALSREVDQRSDQDLRSLSESGLPLEVRGFVVAINRLLGRVKQSVDMQHRFVADAAHELRSPLTALSLQAERLADAEMSDAARQHLDVLRRGIGRNRQLVDQLLTLATAQGTPELPEAAADVQPVVRRVLEDLMTLAHAKRIDLSVQAANDISVPIAEGELVAVIKNLVDNAVRYTPQGGCVELSVNLQGTDTVLQVRDSGPGIALAERGRVFDPFYRVLGTEEVGAGLGLSIVKSVVERRGGRINLDFADEEHQSGLCVTVLFRRSGMASGSGP
jgi:two-component system OmpR family sensor kinase